MPMQKFPERFSAPGILLSICYIVWSRSAFGNGGDRYALDLALCSFARQKSPI